MRPRPVLLAALTLGLVLPVVPGHGSPADAAVEPAQPRPVYQEYVSLGDSWSADVKLLDLHGLPDARHAPLDCAQSQTNYPKLLAKELRVKVHRDATCGSATTDDFYRPQSGLPAGGTNPAQFDRLTKKTDLVTIGIGGNDAGISSAALSCLNALPVGIVLPAGVPSGLPLGGCKERLTKGGVDQLARNIRLARPKLVRAIREVRRRSPKARILMVDYLAAVAPRGCYPRVPMTDPDMRYLHATFLKLNAMVRRAARIGGAEFVDTYRATLGHDVCQGPLTRYAEVLGVSLNGVSVGIPAHPNPAGARAQFRAVLAQVRKR
ncbi:MAG: SGNH/GDSL hydrolase family protein [Nocardioides sp.]|nr:SGNH/GDSL hydrolase family protein [Nocardioides sp.]